MKNTATLAAILTEAVQHHQSGDVSSASRLYERVLELDPTQSDALNLLAVITAQSGDIDRALKLFDRAATAAPNVANIPYNRANALRDAGQRDEARNAYETALGIDPNYADARLNLGVLLHDDGKPEAAIAQFNSLLAHAPNMAQAHYNLGKCRQTQGRLDDAKDALSQAIRLSPQDPDAHFAMANVLNDLGAHDDAIDHIKIAIKLKPNWSEAFANWGKFLCDQDKHDQGLLKYEEALALNPDNSNALTNKGLALLTLGEFKEGWACYKSRVRSDTPYYMVTETAAPAWTGQDLRDKHILIEGEQGLGDEILFASTLREFASQARKCSLTCSKKLISLLQRSFGDVPNIEIHERRQGPLDLDALDFKTTYIDVAETMRPTFTDFPTAVPFLKWDTHRARQMRNQYKSMFGQHVRLVGLSWGSTNPVIGASKSIPLETWTPLLNCDGIKFVVLQPGASESDIKGLPEHLRRNLYIDNTIDSKNDLEAALCQISALDLTVTCSNTVAHLSGASGQQTWVLLPPGRARLWYWFAAGRKSPWYPNVSLYRRRDQDSWADLMNRVKGELPRNSLEK